MHPYADPLAILWWARHLHSTAIENDTYYAEASEVTAKGMKQLPYLIRELKRLQLDIILCSPAIRATKIVMEQDSYLCPRLFNSEAVKEWPRATAMIGQPNSDPAVGKYLESRVRRFKPGGKVLPGEDSFEETFARQLEIERVVTTLAMQIKARKRRPARIGIVSHGNSGRQFRAYGESNGEIKEFRKKFLEHYNKMGIDPATIMSPMWYGKFFRNGHVGWNVDEGYNRHLPRRLRDSVI